jgi:hypothetical protein
MFLVFENNSSDVHHTNCTDTRKVIAPQAIAHKSIDSAVKTRFACCLDQIHNPTEAT